MALTVEMAKYVAALSAADCRLLASECGHDTATKKDAIAALASATDDQIRAITTKWSTGEKPRDLVEGEAEHKASIAEQLAAATVIKICVDANAQPISYNGKTYALLKNAPVTFDGYHIDAGREAFEYLTRSGAIFSYTLE